VLVPEHTARDTERFLEVMRGLGDRLGPLVLQFPYFNRGAFDGPEPFLERLEAYLESLPRDLRYAVEVRNGAWMDEPLLELLRRHRVAFCLLDLAYVPHPADLAREHDLMTADFSYARLVGDRKKIDGLTDRFDRVVLDQRPRLERWAELLRELAGEVGELFVYANNHYAGHGPATIGELRALVEGREPGAPPRVPETGELPF
jgi:uncharacterized protein YecE (DUF72 family)